MNTKLITKKIVEKACKDAEKLSDMTRTDILHEIKHVLMTCEASKTSDVMAQTTQEKLENPIYTKIFKFPIAHETEMKHPEILELLHNIECVSVSCDSEDFSTCLVNDIRINTKNKYNEWANSYASSFSEYYLRLLLCLMRELGGRADEASVQKDLYSRFLNFTEDFDSPAFIKDVDKFEEALDLLEEAT